MNRESSVAFREDFTRSFRQASTEFYLVSKLRDLIISLIPDS